MQKFSRIITYSEVLVPVLIETSVIARRNEVKLLNAAFFSSNRLAPPCKKVYFRHCTIWYSAISCMG